MSFDLGEHSPSVKRLVDEIESATITSETPDRDSASESIRRKLEDQLEAASQRSETLELELETVLEEPQDMADKLDAVKPILRSHDAIKAFKDLDIDLDILMDNLASPTKKVHFDDTSPSRRSSGRRQSMQHLQASAIKQSNRLSVARDGKLHAEQNTMLPEPNGTSVKTVTIDGRKLHIAECPTAEVDCTTRLFDKTTRKDLDAKDRQTFVRYATTWVLPKTNKLTLYTFGTEDSGTIRNISNLQSQLKKL